MIYDDGAVAFPGPAPEPPLHRCSSLTVVVAAMFLSFSLPAQQPNGASSLSIQYRQGPAYPIVALGPNNGSLAITLTGAAGAPFIVASGPLNPSAAIFPGGLLDIGTPPALTDLVVLADGYVDSIFAIGPSGFTHVPVPVAPNTALSLAPIQGAIADPFSPVGYTLTAASHVGLKPSMSVLFIQGDFDPGFGFGPHCRLADTSPVGFSTLRDALLEAGFLQVIEVVDASVSITPQLLSPHGIIVLGTNRKTFDAAEENAIESHVRAGAGLVSYSDSQFGSDAPASDNQILSRFGLLTSNDNFGGPVLATTFVQHPISAGLPLGVRGEGVSLIEIVGNATDTFTNVIPCLSNVTACFPNPAPAPSGSPNPTFSACAAVGAGSGRVVATFDRNTFFNFPGYGSNIFDVSNLQYALNLFFWAGGY